MKILFIQLPLLDHGYNYILGNVPYAPSSITAYIRKHHKHIEIDHLPFVMTNFASTGVIIKYIVNTNPDMVCFTSYLWNIERNLQIAEKLKNIKPEITTVFGGPEIQIGSWAFIEKHEEADYFVSGEGEWFFDLLFSSNIESYASNVNGNCLVSQPGDELIKAARIVEPFTSGHLNTMIDGSIFLELTRGCPYRCSYCYYSKNCNLVRELSFDNLVKSLRMKDTYDLKEIYILSPTFNTTRDFEKKLKILSKENRGVRLHTEMRTQGIDEGKAWLLFAAGFRSLEVGIQTLTPQALKRIGRTGDPEKELAGMSAIKRAGIDIKIGVIPGLPGDTLDGFIKSLDRLIESGFEDNIELYPLMMLPGTRIRDDADTEGANYQKKPPYYFLNGWGFDFNSIKSIIEYVEELTGYTQKFKRLPDFIKSKNAILNQGIRFEGNVPDRWDIGRYRDLMQTAVFSFHIENPKVSMIPEGLRILLKNITPESGLYNVIFYSNSIINEQRIIEFFLEADTHNFVRRINLFDEWKDGLSIMFYQVFDDILKFEKAEGKYELVDPIFKITEKNYSKFLRYDNLNRANLLVCDGTYEILQDYLIKNYKNCFERIAFENEAEQERFFASTGNEYVNWPFGFGITVI